MWDNYIKLSNDDVFWRSLRNTVIFLTVTVNVSYFLALALSQLLARVSRGQSVMRTILMIPMMFAPVLVGFQFAWFFNATVGLVNNALISFGWMTDPKAWLVDQPTGMIAIMMATIWMNVPMLTIILLAGTLSLPQETFEAARVDGASAWQRFKHITLPLLSSLYPHRPHRFVPGHRPRLRHRAHHDRRRPCSSHRNDLDLHRPSGNPQLPIRTGQRHVHGRRCTRRFLYPLPVSAANQIKGGVLMYKRRKIEQSVFNTAAFVILILIALPAIWIIFTALRPGNEVNVTPPIWIPQKITLDAFLSLFGFNPDIAAGVPVGNYMWNSIRVAVLATIVSVALGTMAGYAFSRFRFKGHTLIFLLIMLSRAVPGVALGLPLFLLMRKYGLVDTVHGLALVYVAINIPFTAWLMDGFFRQIPTELDEAAYIDGCSHWTAFWRIDLPLAWPGMAAASIFAFLAAWNEYQIASLITKTPAAKTFPVGLFDFTSQFTVDWRGMCAMSVLMILPAIIFVILTQRRLTEGLTFGAIKG